MWQYVDLNRYCLSSILNWFIDWGLLDKVVRPQVRDSVAADPRLADTSALLRARDGILIRGIIPPWTILDGRMSSTSLQD